MLVEDDRKIARILTEELQRYNYDVTSVQDFNEVKVVFEACRPDVVLMDINLPRYDGFYWCRQLRAVSKVPIVYISARDQDVDQIRALENGGDDYIIKPFHLELAMAKINSILRRAYGEYAAPNGVGLLHIGDVEINGGNNTVKRNGIIIELSVKEFGLFKALAERAGDIVSRDELLEVIWDDEEFVDDNTLTVNVTRLRRRLDEIGLAQAIETKRGQGYRLCLQESERSSETADLSGR